MTIHGEKPKSYTIEGQMFTAPALPAGLYVVATPIGNLGDMTLRALKVLAGADLILCEDTRQSARLLTHYGIFTRRSALHEHNERARIAAIVEKLADGQAVALISDAGTPLISDPGFPLVRAVVDAGYTVTALPGASAVLTALASAGLPTDRFTFIGFLPPKSGARASALQALSAEPGTLVIYESPKRLGRTLAALRDGLGAARPAAVALELTKKFERIARGSLGELAESFGDGTTRGEAVILVSGAEPRPDDAGWQAALAAAMQDKPLRMAVDEIATAFALKRKQVYDAALALKNKG